MALRRRDQPLDLIDTNHRHRLVHNPLIFHSDDESFRLVLETDRRLHQDMGLAVDMQEALGFQLFFAVSSIVVVEFVPLSGNSGRGIHCKNERRRNKHVWQPCNSSDTSKCDDLCAPKDADIALGPVELEHKPHTSARPEGLLLRQCRHRQWCLQNTAPCSCCTNIKQIFAWLLLEPVCPPFCRHSAVPSKQRRLFLEENQFFLSNASMQDDHRRCHIWHNGSPSIPVVARDLAGQIPVVLSNNPSANDVHRW